MTQDLKKLINYFYRSFFHSRDVFSQDAIKCVIDNLLRISKTIDRTSTKYQKINNDLVYNLYLGLDDLQKDNYTIPHPYGDLNVSAPKVFDTSKPLRLRGKGYNGGDMYVKLNVKFERND